MYYFYYYYFFLSFSLFSSLYKAESLDAWTPKHKKQSRKMPKFRQRPENAETPAENGKCTNSGTHSGNHVLRRIKKQILKRRRLGGGSRRRRSSRRPRRPRRSDYTGESFSNHSPIGSNGRTSVSDSLTLSVSLAVAAARVRADVPPAPTCIDSDQFSAHCACSFRCDVPCPPL